MHLHRASCVTANRSCLSEFPARISPPHASWVIVSLHSAILVRGRIFLGRGSVVGNLFFLFQYLPLSDFCKNNTFQPSKGGKGPGIDVCIGLSYILRYFSLWCDARERGKRWSNSNIRVTRSRSGDSFDDHFETWQWCRFERWDFVRLKSSCMSLDIKEN